MHQLLKYRQVDWISTFQFQIFQWASIQLLHPISSKEKKEIVKLSPEKNVNYFEYVLILPTLWSHKPMVNTKHQYCIFQNVLNKNLEKHSKLWNAFELVVLLSCQIYWTYKLVSMLPNMNQHHDRIIHLMDYLFSFFELVFHQCHLNSFEMREKPLLV